MRVLSLIHGPDARSGLFGEVGRSAGHDFEERSYALGRPPADPPESYDAVMVFGGAMNVHEVKGHPWIREETRVLARLLETETPVLGICLGGQLVAAAAGAAVTRAPRPEIGWCEVELTPEASDDPLFAGVPGRFTAFQWHSYQFALPAGATPLARSPVCSQAYRLGSFAWGTQFHAEVTREILSSWIARYGTDPDALRIRFDPARERRRMHAELPRWNDFGRGLVEAFLRAAGDRTGVEARAARA